MSDTRAKILKAVFGLLLFLILFLLINGVLFVFYETYDYSKFGGDERLDELNEAIENEKLLIKKSEQDLKKQEQKIENIISQIESLNNKPEDKQALLEEYSTARLEYQKQGENYKKQFDAYTEKVRLYNELVDKQINRWYLLPIPIRFSE